MIYIPELSSSWHHRDWIVNDVTSDHSESDLEATSLWRKHPHRDSSREDPPEDSPKDDLEDDSEEDALI